MRAEFGQMHAAAFGPSRKTPKQRAGAKKTDGSCSIELATLTAIYEQSSLSLSLSCFRSAYDVVCDRSQRALSAIIPMPFKYAKDSLT